MNARGWLIVLAQVATGCSGGGGCSSGMEPIPAGFEPEARIENAASVRLTDSGLTFIEEQLPGLAGQFIGGGSGGSGGGEAADGAPVTFEIPESESDLAGSTVKICPGGAVPDADPPRCVAEVDLEQLTLDVSTLDPNNVRIDGTVTLRLADLLTKIIGPDILGTPLFTETTSLTLTGNQACPGQEQTFATLPIEIELALEVDENPSHSRQGLTKVSIVTIAIDEEALQSSIKICDSFSDEIINLIVDLAFPLIYDQLESQLRSIVEEQLCQKADNDIEPPCPTGSADVDGVCRYGTEGADECVSVLLGLEGRLRYADLLASLAPGMVGGLDFLLAAGGPSQRTDGSQGHWGDLYPKDGGATLGMVGGALAVPISDCVAPVDLKLPTGIPIPDELLGNTISGWPTDEPGPYVGIAIAERFANHALGSAYQSGALCIAVTGESIAQLSTGLFSLLIPSLKDVSLQREAVPLALVIRPGTPPRVTFGNGTNITTDPLLDVRLDKLAIDFYVWSLDRYVRVMTATYDVRLPLNVDILPEGLQPVIETVELTNGVVENSRLLLDDPAALATTLQEIVSGQVGSMLGGAISPIDVSSLLSSTGLELVLPPSEEGKGSPALRKLEKGTDRFIGLFAALKVIDPNLPPAETSATLEDKQIDPQGLAPVWSPKESAPRAIVRARSSVELAGSEAEFSSRLVGKPWRPFRKGNLLELRDPALRAEGAHTFEVTSRRAGAPMSVDPTPAQIVVRIDQTAPTVSVEPRGGAGYAILAHDNVSASESLLVRHRQGSDAWSTWLPPQDIRLSEHLTEIDLQVRDEEGNIGTSRQALIRNKAESCAIAAGPSGSRWGVSLAIGGVLAWAARRRRRAGKTAALALGWTVMAAWPGCSCSDETETPPPCEDCALPAGLIGAYTSTAVAADGTLWVAGYNEASWENSWGDLVVGRLNGQTVQWETVDGLPTDEEPTADPSDLRKGLRGSGDDVGLWTSIVVGSDGEPRVSYFDRTNQRLKFASRAGGSWTTMVVDERASASIGRYSALVQHAEKLTIAYQFVEPRGGGVIASGVRVATSSTISPRETSDWTTEDAVSTNNTPCRDGQCGDGYVCLKEKSCTKIEDESKCGVDGCESGKSCVAEDDAFSCQSKIGTSAETYPDALGNYVSAATNASGKIFLVYYDRIGGNLELATKDGSSWKRAILDGQTGTGETLVDTGDVGASATAAFDAAGDLWVAYVDSRVESLKLLRATNGVPAGEPLVVDDGTQLSGKKFSDGKHIVGDDAFLLIDGGQIGIAYQDATAGTLRYAKKTDSGFDVRALALEDPLEFAGYFPTQFVQNGSRKLTHFWRKAGTPPVGEVRIADAP